MLSQSMVDGPSSMAYTSVKVLRVNAIIRQVYLVFTEVAVLMIYAIDYGPWTMDFSTYLCAQMNHLLENWELKAKEKQKANKQFLQKLQTKRGKGVEKLLPELHEEAFSHIDCLQCAGCCKTISPRFKTPDIKRISKHLGLKESVFIETYLRLDEEGDYVVKRTPCPFLGADNYCGIYDVRPGDCENYPYTDSYDFFKRPNTTFLNSTICPAVYYVLERLKAIMK